MGFAWEEPVPLPWGQRAVLEERAPYWYVLAANRWRLIQLFHVKQTWTSGSVSDTKTMFHVKQQRVHASMAA